MLRAQRPRQRTSPEEEAEGTDKPDISLFPLAIPMLAGPGAISTVMVLVSRVDHFWHYGVILAAIALTAAGVYYVLQGALVIERRLGRTGLNVLQRVMGLILAAVAGSTVLWADFLSLSVLLALGVTLSLGLIGFLDDWTKLRRRDARGLLKRTRLFWQGVVALAFILLLRQEKSFSPVVEMPFFKTALLNLGPWMIPFAVLVLVGTCNAVNLADGMDGLAVGCTAIALATLGVFALTDPRHQVLVPWCASLAGACVGFLWLNGFPAAVFLGDIGALGLGAALGAVGLVSGLSLWLLIIGGVFVMEALSVILQVAFYKWRDHRRIFRVAPLHHHFQVGGMSEPKVVVRFWIAGLLLAVLSLTGLT
jgi:phospho-N-acetylmuramoyl-pentapeptide-transferase